MSWKIATKIRIYSKKQNLPGIQHGGDRWDGILKMEIGEESRYDLDKNLRKANQ